MPGTTFISDNTSSPGGHYVANWGDTGVQVRFHLIEQRNFSVVAFLGERIPTGKSVNGNDINLVTRASNPGGTSRRNGSCAAGPRSTS